MTVSMFDLFSIFLKLIVSAQRQLYYSRLDSFRSDGKTFREGKTVELIHGDFLRIKSIWQDCQTTEVFLRGWLLRRSRYLGGFMTPQLNETCWIQEIFLDGSGEPEDVPLHLVLRIRQLRMTNKPYEQFNIAHTQTRPTPSAISKSEGVLFCRFRFCTIYESQAQKKKSGHANFFEKFISSLEPDEIDAGWLDDSSETRSDIAAQASGASRHNPHSERVDEDLWIISRSNTIIGDNHVTHVPVQEYTFGDVFCGAGGVSCGAKQAGLKVIWGLERDVNAANNFHQNFPSAVCEVASVEQFINFSAAEYKVDIMHVSPPCPSFSPMQTIKGKDFEEKQVVILSLNELVKMIRPRIVTMEETFGLLFDRNTDFFATVVRTLNDYRYSVRWRILDLSHYGAPQARRRLIMVAAGYALDFSVFPISKLTFPVITLRPGEILPPFPQPTHLHQRNTIRHLIANLSTDDPLHNPRPYDTHRAPYDADGLLREIIACTAASCNYHPDGHRPFTVREFACLQTFPRDYIFTGTNTTILRQIGNAVPPIAAKTIFQEIIKSLKKTDGVV